PLAGRPAGLQQAAQAAQQAEKAMQQAQAKGQEGNQGQAKQASDQAGQMLDKAAQFAFQTAKQMAAGKDPSNAESMASAETGKALQQSQQQTALAQQKLTQGKT